MQTFNSLTQSCFQSKKALISTLAFSVAAALSTPALASEKLAVIDVLVLYSPGVETYYSGEAPALTRINHLLEVTNQAFVDSDVKLKVNLVHARKVNYPDASPAESALNDVTYGRVSEFSKIAALRKQYNADMVIFYRPFHQIHGSCGVAWVGGNGTNGNFGGGWKDMMYSHVGINTCGDFTTAHELGHNLGLKHSRAQDKTGGTFSYALGHGVSGVFVDIMAYASSFKVNDANGQMYKFANPLKTCRNLPCGVDRTKSNGADGAFALNISGPQVANFFVGQTKTLASEITLAGERLDQAKIAMNKAVSDHAAQVVVNNAATAALVEAKNAVAALKTAGGKPFEAYQAQVKALAAAETALASLAKTKSAATSKYNLAATQAAKAAALKALQAAEASHKAQADKVALMKSNLATAAQGFSNLITQLDAATTVLADKTAKSAIEKAKLASLAKLVSHAQANHKAILADYNALAKKLTAAGQPVAQRT